MDISGSAQVLRLEVMFITIDHFYFRRICFAVLCPVYNVCILAVAFEAK